MFTVILAADMEPERQRFIHYGSDEGLSQSSITSIAQDGQGFMWFGTYNGLNRFDAYSFRTYEYIEGDSGGLSHSYISCLIGDREGRIWAGTSDGLNCFDPRTKTFRIFMHDPDSTESISDDQIESLLEDRDGDIWVGTRSGGVNRYSADSGTFECWREDGTERSLSGEFIRSLHQDADGNIWLGGGGGTVDILLYPEYQPMHLTTDGKAITDQRITAITEGKDGSIWIGSQGDGLFHFSSLREGARLLGHYGEERGLRSDIVLTLLRDRNGNIWIGTEDAGISVYNPESDAFSHIQNDPYDPYSLNHNSVWTIFEDRDGNIWVGTYGHGINFSGRYQSGIRGFQNHPGQTGSLSNNMVNGFQEDSRGRIWIATDGGGLNRFDPRTGTFTVFNTQNSALGSNVILSVYEDEKGTIWTGTWADGLYHLDSEGRLIRHYRAEADGLGSDRIMDITGDGNEGLWIATFWGGLTRLDLGTGGVTVFSAEDGGLSDNNSRTLFRDSKGRIWVGTDIGLDCYDTGRNLWTGYRNDAGAESSLSKGFINSVTETSDGRIWIATTGGLNMLDEDRGTVRTYTKADGLPSGDVKAVLETEPGILWLSTNAGICRLDVSSGDTRVLDRSDGLQGNEFNTGSALKLRDGALLFGGNNGFNSFYPADLERNPVPPPVIITGMKIFNKDVTADQTGSSQDISVTASVTMTHRENLFTIEFTALNYLSPEKNRYRYRLKGFDRTWIEAGSARFATYTNLDAGNYIFQVNAANNDEVWNESGASLEIRILPPFWLTWWAILIEMLLTASAVYFVINHFISRQRLENALKMEHLQLEKMHELEQTRTRFFSNIAHEFHSPMTLIISPLERLLKKQFPDAASEKSIRTMHRNAERLRRMIGQLRDFQKIENGELDLRAEKGSIAAFAENVVMAFHEYAVEHRIDLEYAAPAETSLEWFDPDKLDKILYNLLSNAFKFTPDGGRVRVSLDILEDGGAVIYGRCFRLSVKDTGIGIPRNELPLIFRRFYRVESEERTLARDGSGIGLSFVKELVQLCRGDIRVLSEKGRGTEFIVEIPLDDPVSWESEAVAGAVERSEKNLPGDERNEDAPLLLLAEDDAELNRYLSEALRETCRVISVGDGNTGMEKALETLPDLVISDIKMPGMDGLTLCHRLKSDVRSSHIPVILLTSYSSAEFRKAGLTRGADAYLPKPVSIEALTLQVGNLLQSQARLREKYRRENILAPSRVEPEDLDGKFLRQVVKVIEDNIEDSRLNAEKLGRRLGMSRVQLYRKLASLTDRTVNEFIAGVRLQRAVQLLEDRHLTITEIAYAVGYNDLTYFARSFRKHYKKSPSEYRTGAPSAQ